jgi:hypothetical protein
MAEIESGQRIISPDDLTTLLRSTASPIRSASTAPGRE